MQAIRAASVVEKLWIRSAEE